MLIYYSPFDYIPIKTPLAQTTMTVKQTKSGDNLLTLALMHVDQASNKTFDALTDKAADVLGIQKTWRVPYADLPLIAEHETFKRVEGNLYAIEGKMISSMTMQSPLTTIVLSSTMPEKQFNKMAVSQPKALDAMTLMAKLLVKMRL